MGNLRMNADQISYKGGEKPMSVEEAIKNAGNTGLAHTADIAPDFSTESAYSAGDYVYHNGTLYVFTADHAAGAWSTSDTQAVTVGGEISTLAGEASDLYSGKANQITIAPFFSAEASYDPGDLVYYNGLSYRCTNAHTGEWDADDFAATTIAGELADVKSGLTNYEFTDSITAHAQWVNTSITDITNYAGRVIYGYMTDTTLGRTYSFAMPVNNMPTVQAPIWVQNDPSDTYHSNSIFVAKWDQSNALCIFLGSNIPDMTLYLFVH